MDELTKRIFEEFPIDQLNLKDFFDSLFEQWADRDKKTSLEMAISIEQDRQKRLRDLEAMKHRLKLQTMYTDLLFELAKNAKS